MNISYINMCR